MRAWGQGDVRLLWLAKPDQARMQVECISVQQDRV